MAGRLSVSESDSYLISKGACDSCGSSDANALYSDGHTHCFSCSKTVAGDGSVPERTRKPTTFDPIQWTRIETTLRGITPDTFDHWHYRRGFFKLKDRPAAEKVHIAHWIEDGQVVAQKMRTEDKEFPVLGKTRGLWGKWLWQSKGRRVVVTEGEIDCMSVSQAMAHKWPVVSLPNGAQSAVKAFKQDIEWLEGYDEVVLMFDQDEAGQAAIQEVAGMLSPGKIRIAHIPMKDANEMLKAGKVDELVRAVWNAKEYRPDGVLSIADFEEEVLVPPTRGLQWWLPALDEATYGRRWGDLIFLGGGTGTGKTDWLSESIAFDTQVLGHKVGVMYLEQDKRETVQRIAGKIDSCNYHIPDDGWSPDALKARVRQLAQQDQILIYDSFGVTDWATIKSRIRFMAFAGCRIVYFDHLTALAAGAADERKMLEEVTAQMAGLAKQLQIILIVVSHLATPEEGSHEEGARVQIRHFKGSRAIGFWAHQILGLERNQQAPDPAERCITTLRVLKERFTGRGTGKVIRTTYNPFTGRTSEAGEYTPPAPQKQQSAFDDGPPEF